MCQCSALVIHDAESGTEAGVPLASYHSNNDPYS
jgi:hypothetical protein